MARPSSSIAETVVTVQPSGSGGFVLSVRGMQMITQGEVRVDYQNFDQKGPVSRAVGLGTQAGLQAINDSPGTIVFRFSSSKPLNGGGELATINLGEGGRVLGVSGLFRNEKGIEENAGTSKESPLATAARLREEQRSLRQQTPEKEAEIPYHRLESVLDRFRSYSGERTTEALARLFAPVDDERFTQTPAVLIADGVTGLVLSIRLAREGEKVNLFFVKNARCIEIKTGKPGEWILNLVPVEGKVDASVTVQSNQEAVEYPLTVAPRLADYCPPESSKDQPYILDYVRTANKVAELRPPPRSKVCKAHPTSK